MSSSEPERELIDTLPPPQRLALAYAPRNARAAWLGFFALDARLSKVVRAAREPMIGQIRLAWWRDRLGEPAEQWPKGEPLLRLLRTWQGRQGLLAPLVDGWEVLLGEPPLAPEQAQAAAAGRAKGAAAVAVTLGLEDDAARLERLALDWAAAELGLEPRRNAPPATKLPRKLRPMVVLHGLARRDRSGPVQIFTAMRLGIFGR
jgi:phytoene synthase